MEEQRPGASSSIVPTEFGPCAEQIRVQLRRILSSSDFCMPGRIRAFLCFIVEESLSGRADRIKAYPIALEVFGRGTDFDAMNDPVVRIEAGRLRRGLERYYFLQGKLDPVLIDMPKGGYAPRFCYRGSESDLSREMKPEAERSSQLSPRAALINWHKSLWLQSCFAMVAVSVLVILSLLLGRTVPIPEKVASRPSIIIKAFETLPRSSDASAVSAGLFDELLAVLSSNGGLAIFRGEIAQSASAETVAEIHPPPKRFILDGAIREANDKLKIWSRLIDGHTREIVWSSVYEADLMIGTAFDHEAKIAAKIATSVTRTVLLAKEP
jgi:TolB-like protein